MADDESYDVGWVQEQSQYQDVMKYPIIQENAVDDDATNGVCVLFDFKECLTTANWNQIPTVQMTYPANGKFIKEIKPQRILVADVDRDLTHQKFRITEVQRSDQNVIVNGSHIIGEYLANNPIRGKLIQGANMNSLMVANQILSNTAFPVPEINFDSDVETVKNISLDTTSTNALNLLIDPDQQGDKPANSLAANFGGEFIFDNFTIYHRKHAGRKRNITVKYGKNIQSWQQDKNIADTYVGIYVYASYTPGPLQATEDNVDWYGFGASGDWTSVATVTYNAGGYVDVYDSPVKGGKVIRQITDGTQIKLGKVLSDGDSVPTKNDPSKTAVVSTVNGDQWYPIAPEDGGGWVDATWINFDKTGDYVVNDVVGQVHIDSKAGQSLNRYPAKGTATVSYSKTPSLIHIYYSPDQGPLHYRVKDSQGTELIIPNGAKIQYDYVAYDENGKAWYRMAPHEWVYGPHLSLDKTGDVQKYPSTGQGLVKKNAKKYKINTKTGEVSIEYKHLSLAAAKKQNKKKTKTVIRKGKKTVISNPDYRKGKAITHKNKYYKLNYGQVVVAGTTYYKLSDGSYVKSSDIDWKASKSSKPASAEKIQDQWADERGKVEMYSSPSKGSAINWSIPDGQQFAVSKSATGADGKTWYQVTYKDHTGWIPADSTNTDAPDDLEPQAIDQNTTVDDTTSTAVVDVQDVLVELDDSLDNVHNGVYYPEGVSPKENAHIMKLDVSSYFKHDDQDQSGLQSDGTWKATTSDIQQLYQLAQNASTEYEIGKIPVSTTASYADLDGEKADLLALHLYDTVNIYFPDYDQSQEVEITGTVWRMAGEQSHFDSVNLGDLPKTWQHELLDQASSDTASQVSAQAKSTNGLLARYEAMLAQEGSNRFATEKQMMKDMGLIEEKTDRNGKQIENQLVSNQEFEQRMDSINQTADDIKNWVTSSGSGVITASPNWQNPEYLSAKTDSGTEMRFSGKGLVFYNSDGTQKLRAGMDSNGQMYGDVIKGGTIEAVDITAATVTSTLTFKDPSSSVEIYIGTLQPTDSTLIPYNTGRVIWLNSNNYESMVSTGQMAVKSTTGDYAGYTTAMHPSYISVQNDANHVLTMNNFASHIKDTVKDWVKSWVRDTLKINGTQYNLLTGIDSSWDKR